MSNIKGGTITVVNRFEPKKHPNVIRKSITRNSLVGNPYKIIPDTKYDRDFVIRLYRRDMEFYLKAHIWKTTPSNIFKPESEKWLKDTVVEYLEGNDIELACYCKPKCCHGDVLKDAIIYIANRNKNKFKAIGELSVF